MNPQSAIPSLISSLRIAVLPLFLYFFNQTNTTACLAVLGFCVVTDYFDGYTARKLKYTSTFGGYYDASTDFIFIMGVYTAFYFVGYYPAWLLVLIAASFILFLATSVFIKKLYDPVGRYLGSALHIGIALTLISSTQPVLVFVQVAFAVFFVVSLGSRIVSLVRKRV